MRLHLRALAAGNLVPAILAFAAASVLLALVMRFNGTPLFDKVSYMRADSGHYVAIATVGYELFPCNPARYPPGSWCGNAAWFPAYPALIRVLMPLGLSDGAAGVLISRAFLLAALVVLAFTLRDFFGAREVFPILLAACLFPGGIYFQVVFPVSQFLFFSCLHMWLLLKRRDVLAGLSGAAAAMSYSTGYVLAAVSGIYLLTTFQSWRTFLRRSLLTTGLTVLGVIGVLAILQFTTGDWRAWFMIQAKYGFDPGRPLWTLGYILNPVNKDAGNTVTNAQNIVVFLMLVLATIGLVARSQWDDASKLFFVYACVFFWAPVALVGPRLGYYRTFSMLMPAVVFFARWPLALVAAFLASFAVLFPLLSLLFFNSKIT